MKEINLPPFYIGQKVEYVNSVVGSFNGLTPKIKKGDIVKVVACELHKGWLISSKKEWFVEVDADSSMLYVAEDFKPIQENFQEISYSEVVKEEKKLISVN